MFKPLATVLCTMVLARAVLAQEVVMVLPQANTNVPAGSTITVQLDKPMTLTDAEEVALVIGAFPCTGVCPGAAQVLGDILYNGAYTPELHPDAWDPYQNISVTVPSWYSGLVQLGVARFYLLGAGLSGQLQQLNTTLNVV